MKLLLIIMLSFNFIANATPPKNGHYIEWADQDTKQKSWEADYKDGKLNGVKIVYDQGNVSTETTYINGKENGPFKEYTDTGTLAKEGSYTNGELSGEYKEYYVGYICDSTPCDSYHGIMSTGQYKNGKRNGLWHAYHKNGKLSDENMMVDDQFNGPSKSWDENGKLIETAYYIHGEKCEKKPDECLADYNRWQNDPVRKKNEAYVNNLIKQANANAQDSAKKAEIKMELIRKCIIDAGQDVEKLQKCN